jgi:hypothetical protein
MSVLAVLLAISPSWGADPCPVPEPERIPVDRSGAPVPVGELDPQDRCLVGAVLNSPTTSGQVGPVRVPIPVAFYEYLLDHPVLMAALVRQLELGAYQFSARGPNQFWADDGDGTQGLLARIFRDRARRIYFIDGFHEGRMLPMVKGRAVIFLHYTPAVADGRPAVDLSLIAYTKLNDPVLSAMVFLLRPLIGEAVTRKMTHAFDVTTELSTIMAREPGRVLQAMAALPLLPEERQVVTAHLQELAVNGSQAEPARARP